MALEGNDIQIRERGSATSTTSVTLNDIVSGRSNPALQVPRVTSVSVPSSNAISALEVNLQDLIVQERNLRQAKINELDGYVIEARRLSETARDLQNQAQGLTQLFPSNTEQGELLSQVVLGLGSLVLLFNDIATDANVEKQMYA